jgi:hypothetical protein
MLEVLSVLMLALSQPVGAVSEVDSSGPSRLAKCQIDNEPIRRCRFTPLFGDGSFNIDLGPRRQIRLVVSEGRALLFVGIAPDKRIRTDVVLHRDRRDRACWLADTKRDLSLAGPPNRICVYSAGVSGLDGLSGRYAIRKAALANPEGVQAYSTDQLEALVGNKLVLNPQSATWAVSRGRVVLREHTWLADRCSKPRVTSQKRGKFDVLCSGSETFGPGNGSISMLRNGDLRLDWWDGVVLYLRKTK